MPTPFSPPPVEDLLAFIDASPSPYHAAATAAARLLDAGFVRLAEADPWVLEPGQGYVVQRGGTLVAWSVPSPGGTGPADRERTAGFRLVGAHTDSPNLRVKPVPEKMSAGFRQVGIEVYGGALFNSWLDRDLGLSGRLALRPDGELRLVRIDRPLLRIPQLAIHLDRGVNERGLVLNAQQHLVPVLGLGAFGDGDFAAILAEAADVDAEDIVGFDIMLHDVQPSTRLGVGRELVSAPRLDNHLSCWAATAALAALASEPSGPHVPVICLFDHEEIGSESATGAAGSVLAGLLERITAGLGGDRTDHLRALAATTGISTDGAHGTHPNYPDRHDPQHPVRLDFGPVIKSNANVRYATDAGSAAAFRLLCEEAGIPVQHFVSRSDMACGSTIGPMTAARLGIPIVDVGVAQLSMHSARELCGTADPPRLASALAAFLAT